MPDNNPQTLTVDDVVEVLIADAVSKWSEADTAQMARNQELTVLILRDLLTHSAEFYLNYFRDNPSATPEDAAVEYAEGGRIVFTPSTDKNQAISDEMVARAANMAIPNATFVHNMVTGVA